MADDSTPRHRRDSRLEAVLKTVVDGVISIDEQGAVQAFNPAAERIFAYAANEVIGRNISMLMPEPYRSLHDRYLRNYLQTGIPRIIGIGREVVGRRRDGALFPMDLAVSEAFVDDQRIFTGIVRDISERRQAEQERERLIAELEAKNEEMERFTSTVSHDLRSPLAPIIGYAELLREQYAEILGPDGLDLLREIETQGFRMLALIEDLLALSRAGYLERPAEPVAVGEVVAEVLAEMGGRIVENCVVVRGELPPLRVPKTMLAQIFTNLIGNAIDYAGAGGCPIEIAGERDGDMVRLRVADHGPGIPLAERERIFELFFRGTTGRRSPGTGLGLATVRKIAHTFGGHAWVEETPAGGSTFCVELLDAAPEGAG
ncbi:MAG: HAMP domain-containing sensor histidine kinase [Desulfuromonadales bacterium]